MENHGEINDPSSSSPTHEGPDSGAILLSLDDAARRSDSTPRIVKRWIKQKKLPSYRDTTGALKVRASDIDEIIERRARKPKENILQHLVRRWLEDGDKQIFWIVVGLMIAGLNGQILSAIFGDPETLKMCPPLIKLGQELDERAPALAESWEISADGGEVIFNIDRSLRFDDGTPVYATAVEAAFVRIADEGNSLPVLGLIEKFEVTGNYTFAIKYQGNSAEALSSLDRYMNLFCVSNEDSHPIDPSDVLTAPVVGTTGAEQGNEVVISPAPDSIAA